jgi:hypothetical protein
LTASCPVIESTTKRISCASIALSTSGNIILKSTAANGCEAFDTLTVTVDALPEVPVITVDGAYLVASADGEIQWYQDNQPIDGETGDSLAIPGSGNFAVEVTNAAGCSVISEIVEVNVTHNDALNSQKILVYPQPASGTFLNFSLAEYKGNATLSIFSYDGRLIQNQQINTAKTGQFVVDISNLEDGIYFAKIQFPSESIMFPWIKVAQ